MINQHDLEDMAQDLVKKSSGDSVPDAALPSLVKFMQEVGENAARHLDTFGEFGAANKIRFHFGLLGTRAALLKRNPLITKDSVFCGGGK